MGMAPSAPSAPGMATPPIAMVWWAILAECVKPSLKGVLIYPPLVLLGPREWKPQALNLCLETSKGVIIGRPLLSGGLLLATGAPRAVVTARG